MVRQTMCGCVHLYQKNQMELFSYCTKYKIMVPQGIPILRYRLLPTLATTTALHHHLLITRTHARRALHLAAASLYRRTAPTVEPTKEKATNKMDNCSDLDRKVSAHTDKVIIGFGVVAYEDECDSEDVNDAEDIDEALTRTPMIRWDHLDPLVAERE